MYNTDVLEFGGRAFSSLSNSTGRRLESASCEMNGDWKERDDCPFSAVQGNIDPGIQSAKVVFFGVPPVSALLLLR